MADTGPRYLLRFDTFRLPHHLTDVLVVGAGVAGYAAALAAAARGARVLVVAKGDLDVSNTAWAQGGIAAVMGGGSDSLDAHVRDTVEVGQGLCDPAVVRGVVEEGPARVRDLIDLGARFDGEPGSPALGLEGGHTAPRVLHARGDATGAEIRDTLRRAAERHPLVELWPETFVVDLLTDDEGACRGVLAFDARAGDGKGLRAVWAGAVVLASGGYAGCWRETTNAPGASGDGVAAALRAGATLRDLEFVQFHPTTLYLAGVPRILISEAVRGEGAHLVDDRGRRFLTEVDPRAELAPRDVVSRAIQAQLARPDVQGVFLDLSHLDRTRVLGRFPGIAAACRAHGLDLATDRIPVRPAAHYTVGGVLVDATGASDVAGLYAAGEASCSGLHGANRLASNSLLEGLVFGHRAGVAAAGRATGEPPRAVRVVGEGTGADPSHRLDEEDLRASLRALLWRWVGIEREGGALAGALGAIGGWEAFAWRVGADSVGRLVLLDMLAVARRVAEAALRREESRGTHFRRDYARRDDSAWSVHLLHRRDRPLWKEPSAGGPAPARSVAGARR
jgi:L-aspartate oxidase